MLSWIYLPSPDSALQGLLYIQAITGRQNVSITQREHPRVSLGLGVLAPFLKFLKTWRWQTCQPLSLYYSFPDIHFTRYDSRGSVHMRECVFLFIMWLYCHKYFIYIIACFSIAVWILVPWQKCFNFHWGAWTVWSINMENFTYTASNLCALHL